jgi:hypothetical protein
MTSTARQGRRVVMTGPVITEQYRQRGGTLSLEVLFLNDGFTAPFKIRAEEPRESIGRSITQ